MTDSENTTSENGTDSSTEDTASQPAENLPDGSGSDNPNKGDTDRDTVSGGPAD
ncbi:hypothetical protein L1277_001314 [Okibacterium sp. HSC-33S16]|uniref:hypothetical protein n=1 Tax=Okibacterium sp. HSC-33S16 TaxID=2910965 RepID=UPI00209F4A08|nr:hypothetical protein [Okibacterium sp. HSC-33S16]MCP2031223.1 hypothetical protein [Okibacterium sp. HSC-33S16]